MPVTRATAGRCAAMLVAGWFVLLAAVLSPPAAASDAEPTYLNSGELLQRALDSLFARIGSRPNVSMISVEPAIITVLTQSTEAAYRSDEWTISRFDYLFVDRDSVSGPAPHQSEGVVPGAENSFFSLAEVNLTALEDIVARARDYAMLEDPPAVSALRIAREVILLPERSYGRVQWRIGLASPRESATVFADGAGRITGADLSGTARAQRLDMLAQDDWPAARVQEELQAAIGDRPIVHGVSVGVRSVSVTAEHPDQANLVRTYTWDYSGVKRSATDMPNPMVPPLTGRAPFRLGDLDFALLPAIKQAALQAAGDAAAVIVGLRASSRSPGGSGPVWRVEISASDGAEGYVDVSPQGDVVEVVPPPPLPAPPPVPVP